jgi:hypothetical protein
MTTCCGPFEQICIWPNGPTWGDLMRREEIVRCAATFDRG